VFVTTLCIEVSIRAGDVLRGKGWNYRTSWYWLFEQDPFLGYRGRPNVEVNFDGIGSYRHNNDGFRDERELDSIAKVPGHRLVICIGESSTYGIGAPDVRQTYPARLEAHLRRISGDEHWFVYNAGYPAYNSYQIVQMMNLLLLARRPEAIVMMSLRNDVEFVARFINDEFDLVDIPLRMAPVSNSFWNELGMRSSLVGLLATRLRTAQSDSVSNRTPKEVTSRGKAFYADNLAQAALLATNSHVRLLVVDQPIYNDDYPEVKREQTRFMRAVMTNSCREHAVTLLAADQPLRATGFVSPNDVHLGPIGYDKLAGILAAQIVHELDGVRTK